MLRAMKPEMAVSAMLWRLTCTVKGKCTRLWRSWTGKKPEGAKRLVGYGLYSTFLCSHKHNRETQHFYSKPWEALAHFITHNKHCNLNTQKEKDCLAHLISQEHEKWHKICNHMDQYRSYGSYTDSMIDHMYIKYIPLINYYFLCSKFFTLTQYQTLLEQPSENTNWNFNKNKHFN